MHEPVGGERERGRHSEQESEKREKKERERREHCVSMETGNVLPMR